MAKKTSAPTPLEAMAQASLDRAPALLEQVRRQHRPKREDRAVLQKIAELRAFLDVCEVGILRPGLPSIVPPLVGSAGFAGTVARMHREAAIFEETAIRRTVLFFLLRVNEAGIDSEEGRAMATLASEFQAKRSADAFAQRFAEDASRVRSGSTVQWAIAQRFLEWIGIKASKTILIEDNRMFDGESRQRTR